MGASDPVPVDETLEHSLKNGVRLPFRPPLAKWVSDSVFQHAGLIVLAVASAVFLGCIISPPSLMDDVDAVQAQIARNMLDSGDWVTARLDGIAYLEKSPLIYWLIAISFKIFGVHDWTARIPVSLAAVVLCWLTFRIATWAF